MIGTYRGRKSIRLPGYDYGQPGLYFITVCVKNMECVFGEIANMKMRLSPIGEIVVRCIKEITAHYPNCQIDEYVVMPNHAHLILNIVYKSVPPNHEGVQNFEPFHDSAGEMRNKFQKIIPRSVGSIIRGFKIGVTKWCRNNGHAEFCWQRNFYEQIIWDEKAWETIKNYIKNNEANWNNDNEFL